MNFQSISYNERQNKKKTWRLNPRETKQFVKVLRFDLNGTSIRIYPVRVRVNTSRGTTFEVFEISTWFVYLSIAK